MYDTRSTVLLPGAYNNLKLRRSIGICVYLLSKINIKKVLMIPHDFIFSPHAQYDETKYVYRAEFKLYHPKILVDIIYSRFKKYYMINCIKQEMHEFMGGPFPIEYYKSIRSV